MRHKLFLAPFGYQGGTRKLFEAAIQASAAAAPDYSGVIYIAPTPRKVRDAQRQFLDFVDREAVIPPLFTTPGQLTRLCYRQKGERRLLSPALETLLLLQLLVPDRRYRHAQAIREFLSTLRAYRPDLVADNARKLTALITERLAGYPELSTKILQAIKIGQHYLQLTGDRGWIDNEGIYEEIVKGAVPLPKPTVVLFDGFGDLTRLEEAVFQLLLANAGSAFALAFDDPAHQTEYQPIQQFAEFFQRIANPETERLAANHPPRVKPVVYGYPSRDEEVRAIVRDIKQRVSSGELKPNEIIVVFPDFPKYAPIVSRTFEQSGIPHELYPERRLAASPPVTAVIELLNSLADDFPRLAFTSVLSSPYFPRIKPVCREWVNQLSLRAGILKGERAWRAFAARQRAGEYGNADRESQRKNEFQQAVNEVLDLCRPVPAVGTLTEFAQALRQLLAELEFAAGVEEEQPELIQDRRAVYVLLNELIDFEQSFGALHCTRKQFQDLFVRMLGESLAMPEHKEQGVLVCSTLETRGLDCKMLYYGGLTESELPTPFRHDPLLPDWLRKELKLSCIERHYAYQRCHFFRLVNTPEFEPFLSYPTREENTLLLPSPFIEDEPRNPEPGRVVCSWETYQCHLGAAEHRLFDELFVAPDFTQDFEVLEGLNQRFGPEQKLSVTMLEQYRRCPLVFYLEQVLGLSETEEPKYNMEARDWGVIVHRVLFELYARGPVDIAEIPEQCQRALETVLRNNGLSGFWRQVVEGVIRQLIPRFQQCEEKMRKDGYLPVKTEHIISGNLFPDVRVKARLDRVDEGPDGYRIIDYKTGTTSPRLSDVGENGTHIQLPIYAHLWSQGHPEKPVLCIGIYDLRETVDVDWWKKDGIESLINATLANVRDIVNSIRQGKFPGEIRSKKDCRNCSYVFRCPSGEKNPVSALGPAAVDVTADD